MSEIKETIKNRQSLYGDYTRMCGLRSAIINGIKFEYFKHHGVSMLESDVLCIVDIVNKLCRLAVSPDHIDTWHDIAGYAIIIEKYHKEKLNADKQ